ncbi:MAG TPA: hypothetical protein VM638_01925 [Actinomycetota bacterium]|nr:hypothetical protein [Actinomycetota bacterium]
MDQPPFDVIVSGRRHLLGAGAGAYEVWEKGREGETLASFPLTDAGLRQAEAAFDELERRGRWSRPRVEAALRTALFWGLGAWLVIGLVEVIWGIVRDFAAIPPEIGFSEPGTPWLRIVLQVLSVTAFRIWVAALVALAALRWLVPTGTEARP